MVDPIGHSAVMTVGHGRDFIVQARDRLVVTAAHCIEGPALLMGSGACRRVIRVDRPSQSGRHGTYAIWATCLFVDPISDIAVLGPPDGQVLFEQSDNYENLVDAAEPLRIAEARFFPHPDYPNVCDLQAPLLPGWIQV
jgi:hypothetical protein